MVKYEILRNDYIELGDSILYRIKALKSFANVKKGDLGGYIEKESNLSQNGNCWVYDTAKVFGNAKVYDNVKVYDNAKVYDKSEVFDNAIISYNAEVFDNAEIFGNAQVFGNARVYENAKIYNNAKLFGNAKVYGNTTVCDRAFIYGNVEVYGKAKVCDSAILFGYAKIFDNAEVYDRAYIYGNAEVSFDCLSEMRINTTFDDLKFFSFINARSVTALLVRGKWLFNVGCQDLIDKDTFLDKIYNTNGGLDKNPHRKQYLDILELF